MGLDVQKLVNEIGALLRVVSFDNCRSVEVKDGHLQARLALLLYPFPKRDVAKLLLESLPEFLQCHLRLAVLMECLVCRFSGLLAWRAFEFRPTALIVPRAPLLLTIS